MYYDALAFDSIAGALPSVENDGRRLITVDRQRGSRGARDSDRRGGVQQDEEIYRQRLSVK